MTPFYRLLTRIHILGYKNTMSYYRRLPDGIVIMQTKPEHAAGLERLQEICFPRRTVRGARR
jgi:hypothetical protein